MPPGLRSPKTQTSNSRRAIWYPSFVFLLLDAFLEEVTDQLSDPRSDFFEGEVSGVQQVEFSARVISKKGFGAGGEEDRVVLAPHGQNGRLFFPQIPVPHGIQRRIFPIVVKELQLNAIVARPIKPGLVKRVGDQRAAGPAGFCAFDGDFSKEGLRGGFLCGPYGGDRPREG